MGPTRVWREVHPGGCGARLRLKMYREMYVYVRFFWCKIVTLPINTHCVTPAQLALSAQFHKFRDRCAQVALRSKRRLDRAADDRSHATPRLSVPQASQTRLSCLFSASRRHLLPRLTSSIHLASSPPSPCRLCRATPPSPPRPLGHSLSSFLCPFFTSSSPPAIGPAVKRREEVLLVSESKAIAASREAAKAKPAASRSAPLTIIRPPL